MIRRRVVRVPASSANLGPGFDCMAAALALHLELEVEETGEFAVETDLSISRGRENWKTTCSAWNKPRFRSECRHAGATPSFCVARLRGGAAMLSISPKRLD